MGWVNYIVVPDWKMMFEISRYMNMTSEHSNELEFIQSDIKKIGNQLSELPDTAFEEKYKDVTLHNFTRYVQIAETCQSLFGMADYYLPEYMLMQLLENHKIKYRIISEFDLDKEGENKDLDKKYKVVSRYYGDD